MMALILKLRSRLWIFWIGIRQKPLFFVLEKMLRNILRPMLKFSKEVTKPATTLLITLRDGLPKIREYFQNIAKCKGLIDSNLFRPPYGKIGMTQIPFLKMQYTIVMWTILSRDFDKKISREDCLRNVVSNSKPGSIIVFHDSLKSSEKMLYALPKFLDYFSKKGYIFSVLTSDILTRGKY